MPDGHTRKGSANGASVRSRPAGAGRPRRPRGVRPPVRPVQRGGVLARTARSCATASWRRTSCRRRSWPCGTQARRSTVAARPALDLDPDRDPSQSSRHRPPRAAPPRPSRSTRARRARPTRGRRSSERAWLGVTREQVRAALRAAARSAPRGAGAGVLRRLHAVRAGGAAGAAASGRSRAGRSRRWPRCAAALGRAGITTGGRVEHVDELIPAPRPALARPRGRAGASRRTWPTATAAAASWRSSRRSAASLAYAAPRGDAAAGAARAACWRSLEPVVEAPAGGGAGPADTVRLVAAASPPWPCPRWRALVIGLLVWNVSLRGDLDATKDAAGRRAGRAR